MSSPPSPSLESRSSVHNGGASDQHQPWMGSFGHANHGVIPSSQFQHWHPMNAGRVQNHPAVVYPQHFHYPQNAYAYPPERAGYHGYGTLVAHPSHHNFSHWYQPTSFSSTNTSFGAAIDPRLHPGPPGPQMYSDPHVSHLYSYPHGPHMQSAPPGLAQNDIAAARDAAQFHSSPPPWSQISEGPFDPDVGGSIGQAAHRRIDSDDFSSSPPEWYPAAIGMPTVGVAEENLNGNDEEYGSLSESDADDRTIGPGDGVFAPDRESESDSSSDVDQTIPLPAAGEHGPLESDQSEQTLTATPGYELQRYADAPQGSAAAFPRDRQNNAAPHPENRPPVDASIHHNAGGAKITLPPIIDRAAGNSAEMSSVPFPEFSRRQRYYLPGPVSRMGQSASGSNNHQLAAALEIKDENAAVDIKNILSTEETPDADATELFAENSRPATLHGSNGIILDYLRDQSHVESALDNKLRWSSLEVAMAHRRNLPGPDFVPPEDPSKPSTSEEECAYVLIMLEAALDMSAVEDNASFTKTWKDGLARNRDKIESGLWQVLDFMMKYHSRPGFVGGRPRRSKPTIGGKYKCFADHVNKMCELLRHQKTACRNLIHEDGMLVMTDDPDKYVERTRNNRRVNRAKKDIAAENRRLAEASRKMSVSNAQPDALQRLLELAALPATSSKRKSPKKHEGEAGAEEEGVDASPPKRRRGLKAEVRGDMVKAKPLTKISKEYAPKSVALQKLLDYGPEKIIKEEQSAEQAAAVKQSPTVDATPSELPTIGLLPSESSPTRALTGGASLGEASPSQELHSKVLGSGVSLSRESPTDSSLTELSQSTEEYTPVKKRAPRRPRKKRTGD